MSRSLKCILGGLVALFFAFMLLVLVTASDPIAVAKTQPGAAGASLRGLTFSDGPFGGHATVQLQPQGEAQPIEITVTRPFWSRQWRAVPAEP